MIKMKWLHLFALFAGVATDSPMEVNRDLAEDASLSMTEYLHKYGYPSESHTVQTTDGYFLRVYRIPYGVKCSKRGVRKFPVLLQHGLHSNSLDFINSGPKNGLGFILADHCYDVWISNSRGNFESNKHISLSSNDDAFWKFSWHEMGIYDTPAVIDYILKITRKDQIEFIGHSQGCTQFFVYASMYPKESHEKVRSMHAFGPPAYMGNMTSPILRFATNHLFAIEVILHIFGGNNLAPLPNWLRDFIGNACTYINPQVEEICANFLFIFFGFDSVQIDGSLVRIIGAHDPAGASVHQMIHYAQLFQSNEFRQYDYGYIKNLFIYWSFQPPRYEIEKIKVPLHLYYGENDWLVSERDVKRFAAEVPNATLHKVPFRQFNHLDFLWARDVKSLLYDDLLVILDKDS